MRDMRSGGVTWAPETTGLSRGKRQRRGGALNGLLGQSGVCGSGGPSVPAVLRPEGCRKRRPVSTAQRTASQAGQERGEGVWARGRLSEASRQGERGQAGRGRGRWEVQGWGLGKLESEGGGGKGGRPSDRLPERRELWDAVTCLCRSRAHCCPLPAVLKRKAVPCSGRTAVRRRIRGPAARLFPGAPCGVTLRRRSPMASSGRTWDGAGTPSS